MSQKNDQIFQLSLTEIAFIITFLLLLLLGYVVFKEESDRKAAQAALADVQSNTQAAAAMRLAHVELASALRTGGAKDPQKVISQLVAADSVRNERDRLKLKVDELNTKLTALVELEERLAKVKPAERVDITREEVISALALQDQVGMALTENRNNNPARDKPGDQTPPPPPQNVASHKETQSPVPIRKQELLPFVKQAIQTSETLKAELRTSMSKELTPGHEDEQIAEVVSAARNYAKMASTGSRPADVAKENSDLRGQVAFLKNRLDARGGRDFPPCWADETGKVEYLFALETKSGTVLVSPAWTARRDASARALPGLDEALNGPHTHQDFPGRMRAIFNWSKSQSPECRHYVHLKSSIADAIQSDRARLMVENYFYKIEARR